MRRLYRSKQDSMIAGVCGGIASYYRTDPTIIRLGLSLIAFVTGIIPFIVFYLIAWAIIPEEI